MKINKRIIVIGALIFVAVLLFFLLKDVLLYQQVVDGSNELAYSVNEDGKTCTVTGIGTYKYDTLYLNKPIDGYTITDIGNSAFGNSNIKFVYMPTTLKTIGTRAFANCTSLIAVYDLDKCISLESIGDYAFERCLNMNNISLPNFLTSIGKFTFSKCYDLKKVNMPENLIHIGDYAFQGCISLENIVLPQGVKTIGKSAFESCKTLFEISIPASVEDIGIMAFAGCSQLKKIVVDDENSRYSSINGHLYNKNGKVFIKAAPVSISRNFIISASVTKIESYAFRDLPFIESITIPNNIKVLGSWIFYGSPKLNTINYEGTIKEWISIIKNPDWNEGSANFTIYCSNGQISKDGTVTYN